MVSVDECHEVVSVDECHEVTGSRKGTIFYTPYHTLPYRVIGMNIRTPRNVPLSPFLQSL